MFARIYFNESDRWYWLKAFLKPGFSHCFIVLQLPNQDVLINPASHYWYIGESEGIYDGTYIDVEIKEPEKKARTIWEVQTCVTAVKQFLGIRKYGIFTPYQLYRYLNGQPIQETESTEASSSNRSGKGTIPKTG